ncbi:MMPL family transporter [Micromonospora olivasterospora]|uniref:RND superfamily putative drug exporter n=1 Tax=Micromonospora olivasterospora TaxID=1880 RepID=A0A562IAT1_MICOL|nr:MMPL family transporter [Micromonospora olivasterospora]TWH68119.1 RND superfamily putative drug exporter [Micromonospora olivasterospora]
MAAFVILVALGIDYSIFLMTRVKEEYRTHGRSAGEAVRKGLAGTGSVITSCGIILAGTFTPLLFSGIKSYLEMGFAIVVGLLLDTFVIRTLLVPAIAVRFGERSWWPGKRQRAADDVPAEPKELVRAAQWQIWRIFP